jgi:hypothetical protein
MKKISALIMLFFAFTNCTVQSSVTNLEPVKTMPISPTANNLPFVTPTPITNSYYKNTIEKLDVENLYDGPWWGENSALIFFATYGQNHVYDIYNRTIKPISVDDVLAQTQTPSILKLLPPYYKAYVSPSGNQALYFELDDTSPTPPVMEDGYTAQNDLLKATLWLWKENQQIRLGEISVCDIVPHYWTVDETKVILVEGQIYMTPCIETNAQAWLIDLNKKIIQPLFPRQTDSQLQVYGITPDQKMLYGFFSDETGANLGLLNLNTLQKEEIKAPIHDVLGWLDNNSLVVIYRDDNSPPYPLGILDIQSLNFINLTEQFSGKYISSYQLSPNKKWIAFTTGSGWFKYDNLWLLKFSN